MTNGACGLGAIGPRAKPVMEGKAVLFEILGLDCFDIEINELDPDKLVDMIVALELTFAASISRTSRRPVLLHREERASG